jgi:hypothetical protein
MIVGSNRIELLGLGLEVAVVVVGVGRDDGVGGV